MLRDLILLKLSSNGPWLGMSDLTKLIKYDQGEIRSELKVLIEENLVKKTGEKKGTKYALASAPSLIQSSDNDMMEAIFNLLKTENKKFDRKAIADKFKTYDAKIRDPLLKLLESGRIVSNNKQNGQLFWVGEKVQDESTNSYIGIRTKRKEIYANIPKDYGKITYPDWSLLIKSMSKYGWGESFVISSGERQEAESLAEYGFLKKQEGIKEFSISDKGQEAINWLIETSNKLSIDEINWLRKFDPYSKLDVENLKNLGLVRTYFQAWELDDNSKPRDSATSLGCAALMALDFFNKKAA